ncbi:DUF2214 family protein [Leeia aquatica]|uniref:DUF2214 family protein n=1 Tax=Leeia aquatica TaxID=2725557 RepID=A0A847S765_9NEIS|nr:DUF2214 family protein [Leeia aquatica]NLR75593.1 DUF2214 family protein [Leeia aquatica]
MSALLASLHHLLLFTLIASLSVEYALLSTPLSLPRANALQRADLMYGLSALGALLVGFSRAGLYEKGMAYYSHSLPFWIKVGAFALAGLLSIRPTQVFLGWRSRTQQGEVPDLDEQQRLRLQRTVALELLLLMVMLVCAALMARGVGYLG